MQKKKQASIDLLYTFLLMLLLLDALLESIESLADRLIDRRKVIPSENTLLSFLVIEGEGGGKSSGE
uniref:Uncharacterized protein n=1 Tax=Romanomermis culicivorax TaxID=13658 RepID=A0A915KBV5_ROMCU